MCSPTLAEKKQVRVCMDLLLFKALERQCYAVQHFLDLGKNEIRQHRPYEVFVKIR